MPTKTTKTAAKSGAKKKPQVKATGPVIWRTLSDDVDGDFRKFATSLLLDIKDRLTALEQAAKPTDPPPAEKWVPKVGDYIHNGCGVRRVRSVDCDAFTTVRLDMPDGSQICGDWMLSGCRPLSEAEIAEHKRKEEESKVTELQEGDGCECSREESDELVALTKDAGLPSFVSKGHPIPLWWQGQLNSTTKGHFTIKQLLPFAEFKRRLLGTIARLKSEAEAKEMAMPLDFGTRVEFDDGREMRVACPWPSKLTGKYSLVDKDGDGNPRFYTVERHRFTVIP